MLESWEEARQAQANQGTLFPKTGTVSSSSNFLYFPVTAQKQTVYKTGIGELWPRGNNQHFLCVCNKVFLCV